MKFIAIIEINDEAMIKFKQASKANIYGGVDPKDYLQCEIHQWIAETFGEGTRVEVREA